MNKNDDAYKILWQQFQEDRETIKDQYKILKDKTKDSTEMLAVLGDSLVKTSDLLLKQTSQVLEFIKISTKDKKKEGDGDEDPTLNEEDKQALLESFKQ